MPRNSRKPEIPVDCDNLSKESLENNGKYINIGVKNIKNWVYLREKLHFKCNRDFVEFLLGLAEKYLCSKLYVDDADSHSPKGKDVKFLNAKQFDHEEDSQILPTLAKTGPQSKPNEDELVVEGKDIDELDTMKLLKIDEIKGTNADDPQVQKIGETQVGEISQSPAKEKFKKKKPKPPSKSDKECNKKSLKKSSNKSEGNLKDDNIKEEERTECWMCDGIHGDTCPMERVEKVVEDSTGGTTARESLPSCLIFRDHPEGVIIAVEAYLPQYTRLGPLVGVPIRQRDIPDDSSMKHIWEVEEGQYVSTEDESLSNWIRWVRPAASRWERTVAPINKSGALYLITTVPLSPGDELLYWSNTPGPWAAKNMDKTSCGGCNVQFEHPLYYRLHCKVFHDASLSLTVRKYHCKVCGEAVLGKQNIMKHAALNHEGKGAYQCQFCSKFFLRLNYLEMHRNYGCSANPHRTRPLCDYCGRKFCQPQKLKVHIKRMHSDLSEVLREFQCAECLKVLGSRAALQRHSKEVHTRPSLIQCARCSKSFQNRSNLKIHMLTHSGVKPFKCQEAKCGAAFTTKQCLQFHYRKVHGLSEGEIPRIVRSVEYTFDAYAGHQDGSNSSQQSSDAAEESHCDEPDEGQTDKTTGEATVREPSPALVTSVIASKASRKWMGEREVASTASLLVEAALDAAERDILPRPEYQGYPEDYARYPPSQILYDQHYSLRVLAPQAQPPLLPYPVSPPYLSPKSPPVYHHHYTTYY